MFGSFYDSIRALNLFKANFNDNQIISVIQLCIAELERMELDAQRQHDEWRADYYGACAPKEEIDFDDDNLPF